jgi:hypothetical protein
VTRPDLQTDAWRFFVQASTELDALGELMNQVRNYAALEAAQPLPAHLDREIHSRANAFRASFDKMRHSLTVSSLVATPSKAGAR